MGGRLWEAALRAAPNRRSGFHTRPLTGSLPALGGEGIAKTLKVSQTFRVSYAAGGARGWAGGWG